LLKKSLKNVEANIIALVLTFGTHIDMYIVL
jgi:hypothetical protein